MASTASSTSTLLDPRKFQDPDYTASGERRASVSLVRLRTLWFNTGTLCNLACLNCYIDSSPRNDRLVYLTAAEVAEYLDEIERQRLPVEELGFTGGEPFMNPEFTAMLEDSLRRGFQVLVLTNAMRPMMKRCAPLLEIRERFGDRLAFRVSLDHYTQPLHELERGSRSWQPTIDGLKWLAAHGFVVDVAGRTCWREPENQLRKGYARLFAAHGIAIDAFDPAKLVLFPEMEGNIDVPEIKETCWDALGVSPETMMCASSRMVIKRRGEEQCSIVPCTLLPYDERFDLGPRLAGAMGPVKLNHPHCAQFCVLGGGACGHD